MFEWITGARRIAALEQQMGELRNELGAVRRQGDQLATDLGELRGEKDRLVAEAERSRAQAASIDALSDRLAILKEHVAADALHASDLQGSLGELARRLAAVEQGDAAAAQAEALDNALANFRVALTRIERQVQLHAEEANRTAIALMERIEARSPVQKRNDPSHISG